MPQTKGLYLNPIQNEVKVGKSSNFTTKSCGMIKKSLDSISGAAKQC